MGCARWKGARLKDLLDKVGLKKEAIEVLFDGADSGVTDKTPDFVKSIPTWKAVEDTTLVAYEMNGAPLPHLNGFPARLIVPGWTGTYWMKHLTTIKALTKPEASFWMNPAYRIPLGRFPIVARFTSQETAVNTPITEIVVNSLITDPLDGANVRMGPIIIGGIAWDGGYGISSVEVSSDGGKTWMAATLGEDLGRFAFRTSYDLVPKRAAQTVTAPAPCNKISQTQTSGPIHNPLHYRPGVARRCTALTWQGSSACARILLPSLPPRSRFRRCRERLVELRRRRVSRKSKATAPVVTASGQRWRRQGHRRLPQGELRQLSLPPPAAFESALSYTIFSPRSLGIAAPAPPAAENLRSRQWVTGSRWSGPRAMWAAKCLPC
jgi:hypothetical protein